MMSKKTNLIKILLFFVLLTGSHYSFAATLQEVVVLAEQRFGGVAFTAERYSRSDRHVYEVELLRGRQIVEAMYDTAGNLIRSEIYSTPRRAARVSSALTRAQITLSEAIAIAEGAVPNSRAIEAEIRLRNDRYLVDLRVGSRVYDVDVLIDSRDGRVVYIDRD